MRRKAYMVIACGVVVLAIGLVLLRWRESPQQPFRHTKEIALTLVFGGAMITGIGRLLRRRANALTQRRREARAEEEGSVHQSQPTSTQL